MTDYKALSLGAPETRREIEVQTIVRALSPKAQLPVNKAHGGQGGRMFSIVNVKMRIFL